MFADDTTITISGSSLDDLEQETNLELLNLHCWLKANKLSLNVAKTEFMVIGSPQKLLAESHNKINIKLEDQAISNVDHAKSLGLINGLLIFCGKKSKILRDFQGQIRGKVGQFRGIFAGKKSKFAEQLACRPGPTNFWFNHSTACNKL